MVEEIKYQEENYKVKEKVSLKTLRVIERLSLLATAVIGVLLTYENISSNKYLSWVVGFLITLYVIVSIYSSIKIIETQNIK